MPAHTVTNWEGRLILASERAASLGPRIDPTVLEFGTWRAPGLDGETAILLKRRP